MEEIIKQSFNYASIRLYKNYSTLPRILTGTTDPEKNMLERIIDSTKKFAAVTERRDVESLMLYQKGTRKTNYFYTTTPTMTITRRDLPGSPKIECDPVKLIHLDPKKWGEKNNLTGFFDTIKDRHIRHYYNNPFAAILVYRIERWIKCKDDVVTVKFYMQMRSKQVNSIYFKKHTESLTFTFNLRTGNFTTIKYDSRKGKYAKNFYTNSFIGLKNSFTGLYDFIPNRFSIHSNLYLPFTEEFNTTQFQLALCNVLGLDELVFSSSEKVTNDFIDKWVLRFAELKKIKTPNDPKRFLVHYYPTEKFIKKNDRKLIAAILDRFGIKSKITIKLLHEFPNTNIGAMHTLCQIFGKDYPKYIGNIDEIYWIKNITFDSDNYVRNGLLSEESKHTYDILNFEKENIIKIINNICLNDIHDHLEILVGVQNIANDIRDHLKMLERIRMVYPEMRLHSQKWNTFRHEHTHLAGIEREIRKGYSIEYIYDPMTVQEIEKPIEAYELVQEEPIMFFETVSERVKYENALMCKPVQYVKRIFKPKLLKTSDDYFEEGSYMHHCVSGYVDKESSIIISLRLGTERVTCEFDIKSRRCIQERYFCDDPPPEIFKRPLEELRNRIQMMSFNPHPIEKHRTKLILNGVIIPEVYPELINEENPFI